MWYWGQEDNRDGFQCLDIWIGPAVVHDQTGLPFLYDHLVVQLLHSGGEDGTIHQGPVLGVLIGKSVEVHLIKALWPSVLPMARSGSFSVPVMLAQGGTVIRSLDLLTPVHVSPFGM